MELRTFGLIATLEAHKSESARKTICYIYKTKTKEMNLE